MCLRANRIIHSMEAWEVSPGAHTLCMEFSILSDPPGGWPDTSAERARRSHEEILQIVEEVRSQPKHIVFDVWLDGSDS